MLKSHEKFHSANGKRQILVVDDELVNRELMGAILQSEYEILYAEDGREALDLIYQHSETLSLVLLDLRMPVMSGTEVLQEMRADPVLHQIPVIVLTADQKAEVESLNLGAVDFIPKPYPETSVIKARILRTIELSEDRQIILSTERDELTGLYNREYFYRYAEQFDHHHRDLEMDAIVVDVNHFHMINERFGTAYGDEVLRRIGLRVREMVADTGGIVCRREADTFLVYCPHGKDYKAILENASIGLSGDDSPNNRVRLRMGVYANVDKDLEVERRFDRAKVAADTVRNSFANAIGVYDQTLHDRELYSEQMVEDFSTAIQERQFEVHYQPKFDIRPQIPVLASAEALVRWFHPTMGMISPALFIPLFEENGLIETLDEYVWRTTAAQIADWKERFGFSVPVSVNVSRVDMYDPHLVDTFQQILDEYALSPDDLYLEITESAYTKNSEQIIEVVNRLREMGFKIEMDDFGTGYSSLNMISELPIDALKLDMQFIRSAFNERRDTRMIEVIVDIADYLAVPVIAEGVETQEQLEALKALGCQLVQGYYFSKPLPAGEYEHFVVERQKQKRHDQETMSEITEALNPLSRDDTTYGKIAYALSSGYEAVYYVDTDTGHYVVFNARGKYSDLQIEHGGSDFWADSQRNIPAVVYRDDRARVSLCLQREALLDQLTLDRTYSITYRLMADGVPTYYTLKAVSAGNHNPNHIVIGVCNIDEQVRLPQTEGQLPTRDLEFSSLAMALAEDVERIYYVDADSGVYQVFANTDAYDSMRLKKTGDHFFDDCQQEINTVVYEADRDRMAVLLEKGQLLGTLRQLCSFSTDYRLDISGRPTFHRLKAMLVDDTDSHHLIIGVSNIDGQVTDEQRIQAEHLSETTYAHIAEALAQNYFAIYYVDTQTDRFVEYRSQEGYRALEIQRSGDDFFGASRENIKRVAHPGDLHRFLSTFTRENVMHELRESGAFTITYRLMFDGVPAYVHMKATRMADPTDTHIVVGVSNIDAQIRREQMHERELREAQRAAYRDSLTSVKSKRAYTDDEASIDARIAQGTARSFALVICDVNDLKVVNDTLGHAAGDELIRTACRQVCEVYAHSPVYRYGGDEFVAILRGADYEHRDELLTQMNERNERNAREGGVVSACGMSVYQPVVDRAVASVFKRADAAMYEDKRRLKEAKGAQ